MADIVERLRNGITDGTDLRWTVTQSHLEAADEIERLRPSLSEAIAERDAAFEMSKCECGTDEACRNLVKARATGRREGMEEAATWHDGAAACFSVIEADARHHELTRKMMAESIEHHRGSAAAIRAAMEKEE